VRNKKFKNAFHLYFYFAAIIVHYGNKTNTISLKEKTQLIQFEN